MIHRKIIFFICLIGLHACQSYSLIATGSHDLGPYAVRTPIEWNRSPGAVPSWTVDGLALQSLVFVSGIDDGDRLFPAISDDQGRAFRENMRSSDLAELIVESFALISGAVAIEIDDLRPADFGPWEGFRFSMQFASVTGLEERAIVLGAVVDARLHVILYRGARDYYFDKYLPQVEQLLASIESA
ncbi:MAG: hypothetical protein OXF98_10570 [Rhodospirillaceae bacterium]|nr:hypothetical protein [Rhodospirillaceae bacterium]